MPEVGTDRAPREGGLHSTTHVDGDEDPAFHREVRSSPSASTVDDWGRRGDPTASDGRDETASAETHVQRGPPEMDISFPPVHLIKPRGQPAVMTSKVAELQKARTGSRPTPRGAAAARAARPPTLPPLENVLPEDLHLRNTELGLAVARALQPARVTTYASGEAPSTHMEKQAKEWKARAASAAARRAVRVLQEKNQNADTPADPSNTAPGSAASDAMPKPRASEEGFSGSVVQHPGLVLAGTQPSLAPRLSQVSISQASLSSRGGAPAVVRKPSDRHISTDTRNPKPPVWEPDDPVPPSPPPPMWRRALRVMGWRRSTRAAEWRSSSYVPPVIDLAPGGGHGAYRSVPASTYVGAPSLPLHAAHGFTRVPARASVGWSDSLDGRSGDGVTRPARRSTLGWATGAIDSARGRGRRSTPRSSGVFAALARASETLYAAVFPRRSRIVSDQTPDGVSGGTRRNPRSSGVGWADPYRLDRRAGVDNMAYVRGGESRALRPRSRPGREPLHVREARDEAVRSNRLLADELMELESKPPGDRDHDAFGPRSTRVATPTIAQPVAAPGDPAQAEVGIRFSSMVGTAVAASRGGAAKRSAVWSRWSLGLKKSMIPGERSGLTPLNPLTAPESANGGGTMGDPVPALHAAKETRKAAEAVMMGSPWGEIGLGGGPVTGTSRQRRPPPPMTSSNSIVRGMREIHAMPGEIIVKPFASSAAVSPSTITAAAASRSPACGRSSIFTGGAAAISSIFGKRRLKTSASVTVPGSTLYVIEQGEVEVRAAEYRPHQKGIPSQGNDGDGVEGSRLIATLSRGSMFGDHVILAQLYSLPRSTLIVVPKQGVPVILWAMAPGAFETLAPALMRRRRRLEEALAAVQILSDKYLTPPERAFIADRLRREDFMPGQTLTRQGDPAQTMYVVESGRALGHARRKGHNVRLVGNFGRNAYFGELALTRAVNWSATVTARDVTRMLVLDRSTFHGVLRAKTRMGVEEYADNLMASRENDLARLRAKDPAVLARARALASTEAKGGEGTHGRNGGTESPLGVNLDMLDSVVGGVGHGFGSHGTQGAYGRLQKGEEEEDDEEEEETAGVEGSGEGTEESKAGAARKYLIGRPPEEPNLVRWLVNALLRTPPFTAVGRPVGQEAEAAVRAMRVRYLDIGEVWCFQGEPRAAAAVVFSGHLQVISNIDPGELVGAHVGEEGEEEDVTMAHTAPGSVPMPLGQLLRITKLSKQWRKRAEMERLTKFGASATTGGLREGGGELGSSPEHPGGVPSLLHTVDPGEVAGVSALLYPGSRSDATTVAAAPTVVWELTVDAFAAVAGKCLADKRTRFRPLVEACPMLARLTPAQVGRVVDLLEESSFAPGEPITQQGAPAPRLSGSTRVGALGVVGVEAGRGEVPGGPQDSTSGHVTGKPDGAFILERGVAVCAVVAPGSTEPIIRRVYRSSDLFGEVALLRGTTRTASVYAARAAAVTGTTSESAPTRVAMDRPGMPVTCAVLTLPALNQLGFLRRVLTEAAEEEGYQHQGGAVAVLGR